MRGSQSSANCALALSAVVRLIPAFARSEPTGPLVSSFENSKLPPVSCAAGVYAGWGPPCAGVGTGCAACPGFQPSEKYWAWADAAQARAAVKSVVTFMLVVAVVVVVILSLLVLKIQLQKLLKMVNLAKKEN